jgi:hypothetical protein
MIRQTVDHWHFFIMATRGRNDGKRDGESTAVLYRDMFKRLSILGDPHIDTCRKHIEELKVEVCRLRRNAFNYANQCGYLGNYHLSKAHVVEDLIKELQHNYMEDK